LRWRLSENLADNWRRPSSNPAAAREVTTPASAPVISAMISDARLQLGHLHAMLRGLDHGLGHFRAHVVAGKSGGWPFGVDDRAHADALIEAGDRRPRGPARRPPAFSTR
jgi:hypothetical protein